MTAALVVAAASTAFVAGLSGSLHCGLMCGPLACAGAGASSSSGVVGWHVGRVVAYTSVGALLGAVGAGLSLALTFSVQPYLPWVMAAGLVMTALDVGRHLKPLPFIANVSRWLARQSTRLPSWGRAAALGAATPFLPCGLLYGVFLAALATNDWLGGAVVLASFSLGAVPVLVAVQLGSARLQRWPRATLVMRRVVPLVAAVVLVTRALLASAEAPACH